MVREYAQDTDDYHDFRTRCKVGTVVPCYQVGSHLARVVKEMPEFVDHIVLVDDGSTDDTARIAEQLGRDDKRLILVRHGKNKGVGAAMKTGFGVMQSLGCDIVVKVDGDGQMNPKQMTRLVQPLVDGWADYTKGNRLSAKAHFSSMPIVRLIGSLALTFMTKLASGYWQMFDPQNGYVAITSRTLGKLDIECLDDRYFFENSMIINLNIVQARCMDVSMPALYGEERSGLRISKAIISFPPKLVRGFFKRVFLRYVIFDFSPIFPLLAIGSLLFFFGSCWGAYQWWLGEQTGTLSSTGTVMLSVLPLFSGLQMLLQALLLDIENARVISVSEDSYQRDRPSRSYGKTQEPA